MTPEKSQSMHAYILQARVDKRSAVYRFRGAHGSVAWPMENGAGLGVAGSWNFLLRLGVRPKLVASAEMVADCGKDLLFVSLDGGEDELLLDSLRKFIQAGGRVIGSGALKAWAQILPEVFKGGMERRCDNPYAALAYGFSETASPILMAPPRWTFVCLEEANIDSGRTAGTMLAVQGERQTPARALTILQPNAPALICWRNLLYLNGSPFHALQAWLQGQEDLSPWLNWRHRLFWLDEWVADMRRILEQEKVLFPNFIDPPIAELGDTCVVLRHDLDYSRDTAYLEAAEKNGMAAVHAILRDRNASFWIKFLAEFPAHETAFHYNTGHYSRLLNWLRKKMNISPSPYVPAKSDICRHGLWRQVRWAKSQQIGIATLHRHLGFLLYPEWVDAIDYAFEQDLEILGGSSFFRAQVLRWGIDRVDGVRGTLGEFPDTQSSFWLPFKVAHAGDGGRLLRGWESASLMESEPELLEQWIDYRIPGLSQRVLTLNYHPAHANGTTFAHDGSLSLVQRVLDVLREREVKVLTLAEVYRLMNCFLGGDNNENCTDTSVGMAWPSNSIRSK